MKTKAIPPWVLMSGDAALRSDEVRRARSVMRDPAWLASHIEGWPHWPHEQVTDD